MDTPSDSCRIPTDITIHNFHGWTVPEYAATFDVGVVVDNRAVRYEHVRLIVEDTTSMKRYVAMLYQAVHMPQAGTKKRTENLAGGMQE